MKFRKLFSGCLGWFVTELTVEEIRECRLIQFKPQARTKQVQNILQAIKGLFHGGIMPAARRQVYPSSAPQISN